MDVSVTFAGIGGKYFSLVFVNDCFLPVDSHPDKTSQCDLNVKKKQLNST